MLALEDIVVGLFDGFVRVPSGREGIKVVESGFLESGVITLAIHILLSLSSSRREGDKSEVGRGSAYVRLVGLTRLAWWERSMRRRCFVKRPIVAHMLVFSFW